MIFMGEGGYNIIRKIALSYFWINWIGFIPTIKRGRIFHFLSPTISNQVFDFEFLEKIEFGKSFESERRIPKFQQPSTC